MFSCGYKFTGQTGQNGYTRGDEHQKEYQQKLKKSALWKNYANVQDGKHQDFQMEIVQRLPESLQMNSKSGYISGFEECRL